MAELVFNIDSTALATVQALQIKANFDEMEAALKEAIEPYENMIVTEDDLPQAKADRAKLNKVLKNIGDHRKMVKKAFMEPYDQFDANCKRLTAVCDRGIENLDRQIKEYENAAKAKKMQALQDYFTSLPKNHPEYARFSDCENPRWTNATYPFEDAQREIENYVLRVETDVEAILALQSKYEPALLEEYQKTGDVSAALMLKGRLEKSEKVMEEKRREAERLAEERRQAEEKRQAAEKAKSPEQVLSEMADRTAEVAVKAATTTTIEEVVGPMPHNVVVVCNTLEEENSLVRFCFEHGLGFTVQKGDA